MLINNNMYHNKYDNDKMPFHNISKIIIYNAVLNKQHKLGGHVLYFQTIYTTKCFCYISSSTKKFVHEK